MDSHNFPKGYSPFSDTPIGDAQRGPTSKIRGLSETGRRFKALATAGEPLGGHVNTGASAALC